MMKYKAAQTLQALAKNAINLAQPNQLTPERLKTYVSEASDYKLLYGTERVTPEVIQALQELAVEAQVFEKMADMQNGQIMNFIQNVPCENRAVLHTATRDFFDDPRTSSAAKSATDLARKEVEKLHRFIEQLDVENSIDEILMIGIGGSDLGPRAHFHALEHLLRKKRQVHFISNVDPDEVNAALQKINASRTLVVISSKSGSTLETNTNEQIVRNRFKELGLDAQAHFVAITLPGSLLDDQKLYRQVFHLWEWVGGRFSTTAMSGGLLLAFAFGFSTYWEFLKGAHAIDKLALEKDITRNIPLLMALLGIWNRNFLDYQTLAIIAYSQGLHRYAAHLQQLDMESNGKLINKHAQKVDFQTGPIIWGEPGTNAQHSFFQLLHQGTTVVPVSFIGFKKDQFAKDVQISGTSSQEKLLANLFAQSLALAGGQKADNPNKFFPGNRPNSILLGEQLTPYALGSLLAIFEHKVAFQGFIWNINSFDQEGVQLGKVLANNILDYFKDLRSHKADTKVSPLIAAYLQHLL